MADRVLPGPVDSSACISEAVCIHTKKIFDSCRDKDCIEDLRVYPCVSSQAYIDSAFNIRPRSAELLYAAVNVEEISFNRGYYTVDVTCFYKVCGEAFPGALPVSGLAVFDKRVILYGSEGSVKVFQSGAGCDPCRCGGRGAPTAVVEVVDPIVLNMKLTDAAGIAGDCDAPSIPTPILEAMGEKLVFGESCRRLYVTIGQFSIIRLERDSQILIPAYDYCLPDKECVGSSEDDPCTMFSRIRFPVEAFFPPDRTCGCPCGSGQD